MRQAETDYLQEEGRLRGARPRVKAVLYPFELDYGLAPGSGEYLNTCYGGAPGKLALATADSSASRFGPVIFGYPENALRLRDSLWRTFSPARLRSTKLPSAKFDRHPRTTAAIS